MNQEASAASAKRKLAKTEIIGDNMVWTFTNDESLTIDWRSLSDDIQKTLMLHGLKQKVGDAAANTKTIRDAQVQMQTVINNLKAGLWTTKRAGSSILAEAMAKVTGCTMEQAAEALSKADDDKIKATRKRSDIKLAIAQIEAERLASQQPETAPSLDDLI